jgi:hypothetical protein
LLYWKYDNDYNGAVSEMTDQKAMFEYYFSNFGFHWFSLNYEFWDCYTIQTKSCSYPINEPFLLTWDNIPQPVAIVKQSGEIQNFNQRYDFGSVLELLGVLNNCGNYCVGSYDISVPKIKYNTSYKCRLNKNN